MIVLIVAMALLAGVLKARYRAQHGIIEDDRGQPQRQIVDADNNRMRDEIKMLKERIQVLERIATDNNSANDLNRQIDELRNR